MSLADHVARCLFNVDPRVTSGAKLAVCHTTYLTVAADCVGRKR
jgi:hypothetical protein